MLRTVLTKGVWVVFALFLAGVAMGTERVVLGKLGQTIGKTEIRSRGSSNARVLYRAKAFEYLVVRDTRPGAWVGILMSNGQTGWVRREKVAKLPYEVTVPRASAPRRTSLASMSRGSAAALPAETRAGVAAYSLNYIGTPYKWGGTDETRGIDCSAFVREMYGRIGVNLPRTAAEQVRVGTPILRLEDLRSGDRLYFWDHRRNKVGHTGIYLGNGHFVHSSSNRRGVATDDLRNPKWMRLLVAARR